MISVRIKAAEAWCGRPGCPHPNPLASMQAAEDGAPYARLRGLRWRRDGWQDGLERYVTVARRRWHARKRDDGLIERNSSPQLRVPCPAVLVCPGCGAVQTIGLTDAP